MKTDKEKQLIINKVISISKNKTFFSELINELKNFLAYPPFDFEEAKKEIETFASLLADKSFHQTAEKLKTLEEQLDLLADQNEQILPASFQEKIDAAQIQKCFDKELHDVLKVLGSDYFDYSDNITIEASIIDDIEQKLQEVLALSSGDIQDKINTIILEVKKMKLESLYDHFNSYVEYLENLAISFEKKVKVEMICDKDIMIPSTLKKLIKSLLLLFTNSIEHGIETPIDRVAAQKDEIGSIKCHVTLLASILFIEISDDGAGIDIEKVSAFAVTNKIKTQKEIDAMFDDDKISLILEDHVSSKKRGAKTHKKGLGVSTIKKYISEVGGSIKIDSTKNHGTKIYLTIPVNYGLDNNIIDTSTQVINNTLLQTQVFLEESVGIEFYTNKQVEHFETRDDNCYIELRDDFVGIIALSFDRSVIDRICDIMLEGMDDEEIDEMKKEIINEIANTVIGLAIQNFPDSIKSTSISIPYSFDSDSIQNLIDDASTVVIKNLYTSHGKISCMLLKN